MVGSVVIGLAGAGLLGPTSGSGASTTPGADADAPVRLFAVERVGDRLEVIRYDAASAREADGIAKAAYGRGAVAVEVDARVQSVGDPLEGDQWALAPASTSFRAAWSITKGANVIVAVVDSGVRKTHQDLAGAVLPGIDLVTGSGDGSNDQNGHGTHVAGIVAARANGKGTVGGAPTARILPVRVLDANGSGYSSDVAEGIIWAADHGARVVNLSLGGGVPSEGTRTAIRYAQGKGVVVVAAAGNSGDSGNAPLYPAAFEEPIAVGAVNSSRQRAGFSNYGSYVDVVAPGDSIVSSWSSSDTAYAWASGTSMATPHVAAVAALVVAANPTFTAAKVRQRIEMTADDLGPTGRDAEYGWGIIDPVHAAAIPLTPPGGREGLGYAVVTSDGRVRTYGGARHYGDLTAYPPASPVVGAARTPSGKGYWLVTASGAVFSFGDARYRGGLSAQHLAAPVVAMASSPTGRGYLVATGDGGVHAFGDAVDFGSANTAIRDLAMSPSGRGYWLLAGDGTAYAFGDARLRAVTRRTTVGSGAVSLALSGNGRGLWAVRSNGAIAGYGAPTYGGLESAGSARARSGTRIRAIATGRGYYVLTNDGLVFPFGTARNFGSRPSSGARAVELLVA